MVLHVQWLYLLDIFIASVRDGFRTREISDINFLHSWFNIADGQTRPMQQAAALRSMLNSSQWAPPIEQWNSRPVHNTLSWSEWHSLR